MSKKINEVEIKKLIIEDVQRVNNNYLKDFPDGNLVTRDYLRSHSKYKESEIVKHFGSFDTLKKEAFGGEIDIISMKKKLHVIEEQNRNLLKENNELIKNSVIEDVFINLYKESIDKDLNVKINNKQIIIKEDKKRVALLQLSDWHIGEEVFPEAVNGVNAYNEEICLERLDTVFNVFIAYCKKFSITKCHILINGDMLSGEIHTELMRNNWMNITDQLFFTQKYLIKKLEYISEFFNRIDVNVIVGNHARVMTGGKPYFKEKVTMNWEYILGKNIQSYFELLSEKKLNNKIFVDVPEGPFKIVNINGTKLLQTHGDVLTGAGGGGFAGIPFYSICQSASKLYGVLHQIDIDSNTKFDSIICGHLHTSTKIPLFNGGFCYIGGCGIGTNEFSIFKMKSVAKKEQLMLVLDESGRIEFEKNITFD
jgi:uncharacterized protein YuzB (UPF0349 family)